jgi:hypothetical protein
MLLMPMCRAPRSPISSSFCALGTTLLVRSRLIRLTFMLRLGVTPISTLSEWTDVLHLSTKWGFEHLRTAAITAILPLASAVDKLVLGRTYGFVDWVPGAYTDLLKREDDLTLDEAKKMALEDVVAIAKGRREARTQSVRPDQDIVHIVKNLLSTHAPAETTSEDAVPPAIASELVRPPATTAAPSTKPAPDRGSVDVENEVKILQWLDRMSCSASRGAAQECLVKFMQEDRARVPVILDTILATGLGSITRAVERGSDLIIYRKYSHSYFNMWDATADGGQHLLLRNMHALDQTLGLVNTAQIEAACFRFADHWRALRRLDLDLLASDVLATPIWRSIDHALTYMVYLHEGPNSYSGQSFSVIRAPAFSAFWVELNSVLKSTPSSGQVVLAHCINVLLKKHGARISKLAVSPEMDAFYLTVSEKRDAAKGSHDHPLVALLEVSRGVIFWKFTL